MVGLLTMTGSASLVGVWAYRRWGNKKQVRQEPGARPAWWQAAWQRVQGRVWQSSPPVTPHNPPAPSEPIFDRPFMTPEQTVDSYATIRYGLHTSTLALGVTTVGRIFFPPLQVAGLPLLVYMGVPAAQLAYGQLRDEGRPSRALAETVVLAVCLASGSYWVGSLGFWLYYGGRALLAEKQQGAEIQRPAWLAPTTAHLWKDGVAYAVPTATLEPGDQVFLHSGEMAPVDGLITEGVAWLRPQALSSTVCGLHKGVGDRVTAADIVLVGQICVRVAPLA
jgi:cation transport ATPase